MLLIKPVKHYAGTVAQGAKNVAIATKNFVAAHPYLFSTVVAATAIAVVGYSHLI